MKTLVVMTMLVACGPAQNENPLDGQLDPVTGETHALGQEIGPLGGVIEGPEGTVYEGLRVEVPVGALEAPTTIEIRPTYDETPLPQNALRVGPQFAFAPPDVSFAIPARVTLPFEPNRVGRRQKESGDVKVWVRQENAERPWQLIEPASSDQNHVAIDLDRLSTAAAAGIRLQLSTSICDTQPSICATVAATFGTCTADFCLQPLGWHPAQDSIIADASAVYYPVLRSTNTTVRYAVQRLDLATKATQDSAIITCDGVRSDNYAIDNGSLWVPLAPSNQRVTLDGRAPTAYDYGKGFGVVKTSQGLVRLLNLSGYLGFDYGSGPRNTSIYLGSLISVLAHPSQPDIWVFSVDADARGTRARRYAPGSNAPSLTVIGPDGAWFGSATAIGKNGQIALWGGGKVLLRTADGRSQTFAAPDSAFFAFDDVGGGLWMASSDRTEMYYRQPDGGLVTMQIATPDKINSWDFIVDAMTAAPDGSVIIRTATHDMYRLRRR